MIETEQAEILAALRGRLVVSCQAYPGEPLRDPDCMARMAESVVLGGAAGIRAQGLEDIKRIRSRIGQPIIGLVKVDTGPMIITPTLTDALSVAGAGADIVAIDGTRRPRPDGLTLRKTITQIHEQTGALVMADAGSLRDGREAQEAGADIVGTTLAGYTGERPRTEGPDLEMVEQLATELSAPVVAEGRIHTPAQAAAAFRAGAFAIVVGTAITHPQTITSWFVHAIEPTCGQ